jgi:recombination protein RecT
MTATQAALRAVATGQAAEQQQPRDPYQHLKQQLERSKAEFLPLMGNNPANVDRFIRVVLNAVLNNSELLAADRRSLIASCMRAAQDGLMPDGRDAVLNIYSTKIKEGTGKDAREVWIKAVQYLPMVGGLVKKLYASGEITSLDAACVYEADRFVFRRGDEPKLEHEPTLADVPGPIVAAYCVVRLKNGDIKREVMPRRDILQVKAASKAQGDNSPWVKWFDQQSIKSVIKRIYKQLPHSDAFDQLDARDNEVVGATSFAATPTSVADIAVRNALPHSPAQPLDFGIGGAATLDPIHAGGVAGNDPVPGWVRAADDGPAGERGSDAPPFNLQALIERISGCASLDALDALADEGRGLPDEASRAIDEAYTVRRAQLLNPTPATQATSMPSAANARNGRGRGAGAPIQGSIE